MYADSNLSERWIMWCGPRKSDLVQYLRIQLLIWFGGWRAQKILRYVPKHKSIIPINKKTKDLSRVSVNPRCRNAEDSVSYLLNRNATGGWTCLLQLPKKCYNGIHLNKITYYIIVSIEGLRMIWWWNYAIECIIIIPL